MSLAQQDKSNAESEGSPSWEELCAALAKTAAKRSLAKLWPELKLPSSILLWGDDASVQKSLADSELLAEVTRLLDTPKKKSKSKGSADWQSLARDLIDRMKVIDDQPIVKIEVLAIAYALPELTEKLGERLWWQIVGEIQELRESIILDLEEGSSDRAMLAGELGLVLAYRLSDLPTCKRMAASSWELFTDWLGVEETRLTDALRGGAACLRSALATGLRSQRLGQVVMKRKLKRDELAELNELAVWAALLTRYDGSSAFSTESSSTTTDLLSQAASELGDGGLTSADRFARRKSKKPTVGLMRVESELPETAIYDENGHLLVMRPSWFDHHGIVMADFDSVQATRIEVSSGKSMILSGDWQTSIKVDGKSSEPESQWEEVCWFSDDDVHYLEIEQKWTHGVTLQRQLMVVREDGAMLLGDSVFAAEGAKIEYESGLPIAEGLTPTPEKETREILLADNKPRALVMPISLPEWRVGFTSGQLEADSHLRLSVQGETRVYAPQWIDFERRRYTRPRTWRNLTVASELEVAAANQAVASRIQLGSEQWLVFRALGAPGAWTFCGKHIAADFFCGRFDPEDGDVEELVTVEDHAE